MRSASILPGLLVATACAGSAPVSSVAEGRASRNVAPASAEDERCATFTDTFTIALADGGRYRETHNDVCGGRTCVIEHGDRSEDVACLPAPDPELGVTATRVRGDWFVVRASAEGIAGIAVVEWTPARGRVVFERDLGLAGEADVLDDGGRLALVANCDLASTACPVFDPPASRSWWVSPSGELTPRPTP